MSSSGTYNYGNTVPPLSELFLDAYERVGKPTTELTPEQVSSGRRSLNLVLVSWSNRGVNLWSVQQFVTPMPQGVVQYITPPYIVDVLPDSVVLRQYQMGAPVSVTPQFNTTASSTSVTLTGLPATPAAGEYVSVGIRTTVGGIVVYGFYPVVSVPASGQATITVPVAATSTVAAGGAVPIFTTSANSTSIIVVFPNHGFSVGQPFQVDVTTFVGGVQLLGPYPVASVTDVNTFTFNAPYPAGFVQTLGENNGLTQLATQATVQGLTQTAYPVDIILYPLSRGQYAAIPIKGQQGRPTSYWLNRQSTPIFNAWPTPDQNGPYELRYWASTQVTDADVTAGQTLGVPYRFLEAFVSDLAAALAVKWAPERAVALKALAAEQWELAAVEDTEKTSFWCVPDTSSYFY